MRISETNNNGKPPATGLNSTRLDSVFRERALYDAADRAAGIGPNILGSPYLLSRKALGLQNRISTPPQDPATEKANSYGRKFLIPPNELPKAPTPPKA